METDKKERNYTTVTVGKFEAKKLKKMADNYKISQQEMINKMIDYFSKTGIDPTGEPENPTAQLAEMNKRLNQVVAFQKEFEKNKLQPVLDELVILERRMKGLDIDMIVKMNENINNNTKKINRNNIILENGFVYKPKDKDGKEIKDKDGKYIYQYVILNDRFTGILNKINSLDTVISGLTGIKSDLEKITKDTTDTDILERIDKIIKFLSKTEESKWKKYIIENK